MNGGSPFVSRQDLIDAMTNITRGIPVAGIDRMIEIADEARGANPSAGFLISLFIGLSLSEISDLRSRVEQLEKK